MAPQPYTEVKVDAEHFQLLEKFTVILYGNTGDLEHANDAKKKLFCQNGKTMDNFTLTHDVPLQHTKRVAYRVYQWAEWATRTYPKGVEQD